LPDAERVPVGVVEPGAACRAELRDVIRGCERSFGVVEKLHTVGDQVLDLGFDVVDFEVGKRVLGRDGGTLEDRELARGAAAKARREGVLPQERQAQDLAVEVLGALEVGHRDRRHDHRCCHHQEASLVDITL
jgi:hypothetical protein